MNGLGRMGNEEGGHGGFIQIQWKVGRIDRSISWPRYALAPHRIWMGKSRGCMVLHTKMNVLSIS